MLDTGFISLHRSLITWEWYDDPNTMRLFIHLLLTVNWEEGYWHGIKIERGSRITSYSKLAKELGLSVQEVRTSLKKLKTTGELTSKATSKQQQYNKNNKKNNIYIYDRTKNFNYFSKDKEFTKEEQINMKNLMNKFREE